MPILLFLMSFWLSFSALWVLILNPACTHRPSLPNHENAAVISFPQSCKVIIAVHVLLMSSKLPRDTEISVLVNGGGEGRWGPAPKRGAEEEQRDSEWWRSLWRAWDGGMMALWGLPGHWRAFVSKPPARTVHVTVGQWLVKLRTERG